MKRRFIYQSAKGGNPFFSQFAWQSILDCDFAIPLLRNGERYSVKFHQVVGDHIEKTTNLRLGFLQRSMINVQHLPPRLVDVREAYCTTEKAESLLGYEDRMDFDTGLCNMFDWAQSLEIGEYRWLPEIIKITKSLPRHWLSSSHNGKK